VARRADRGMAILQIAADQEMRSRVKRLQEIVRQERGGCDDVADRIERYLRRDAV